MDSADPLHQEVKMKEHINLTCETLKKIVDYVGKNIEKGGKLEKLEVEDLDELKIEYSAKHAIIAGIPYPTDEKAMSYFAHKLTESGITIDEKILKNRDNYNRENRENIWNEIVKNALLNVIAKVRPDKIQGYQERQKRLEERLEEQVERDDLF